jgi:hypothetical protein
MKLNLHYILSCLLGIFIKVYDDFTDLKIKKYPILLEVSKIIIILCSFLLIQDYYILSIIILISLFISNYCKKFDNIFWDAYTYFIGFLCFVYYFKFKKIVEYSPYKLLCALFIPICIYIEETTFVEEISKNKMLSRSYGICINSIILLFLYYCDLIHQHNLYFFTNLILFINSYFITNIIIQLTFIYNEKKQIITREKKQITREKKKKRKYKKSKNIIIV